MKKTVKKQSTERDQFTAVLEDIRSHNQVFGEALDIVRDKVSGIENKVTGIENDMQVVKDELSLIRYEMVTRDEFRLLETRVLRLEKSRA